MLLFILFNLSSLDVIDLYLESHLGLYPTSSCFSISQGLKISSIRGRNTISFTFAHHPIHLHSNIHAWEGFNVANNTRPCCYHTRNDCKGPCCCHTRTDSKGPCCCHTRTNSKNKKHFFAQQEPTIEEENKFCHRRRMRTGCVFSLGEIGV